MSRRITSAIVCAILMVGRVFAAAPDDGSVLPFPPTPSASKTAPRLQDSVHKRRVEPERLAKDAPNILVVLVDDAGFGVPDSFGGFAHTPTLTKLSKQGLSFNRFHTNLDLLTNARFVIDWAQSPTRRIGNHR